MEAYLVHIWKGSWILAIFYVIYFILLRRETLFLGNRIYLIVGIITSLALPFVQITKYIEIPPSTLNYYASGAHTSMPTQKMAADGVDFMGIGANLYIGGAILLFLKFLLQIVSLGKLISNGKIIRSDHFLYVETKKNITPFSFFHFIIYNPALNNRDELNTILAHEKAHSKQLHSLDVLISHGAAIVFWFNPFAWLYKKNIQQNLEFLADSKAVQSMECIKNYQYVLLKVSANQFCPSITNNFFNSLIKKRIVMLQKSKSSSQNGWKYLTVFPLLISFIVFFNTKVIAQSTLRDEVHNEEIEILIDKNATEEKIDTDVALLKEKGIDLRLKNIKRNSMSEITAIRLEVKSSQSSASFESNNETAIKPIRISIEDSGKNISIGNVDNHSIYKLHYDLENKEGDDLGADEKHIVVKTKSGKDDDHMIWVQSSDDIHETIEIENTNGKKVYKVNGKEVSKEEFEKMKEAKGIHAKKISIKKVDGNKNKNVIIIKDSDDENDFEIISDEKDGNGFFFIDSGDGEDPIFYIDGKEATKEEVKNLSPDHIKNIDVAKGENAISKYGPKAKDGVVNITTKNKK